MHEVMAAGGAAVAPEEPFSELMKPVPRDGKGERFSTAVGAIRIGPATERRRAGDAAAGVHGLGDHDAAGAR